MCTDTHTYTHSHQDVGAIGNSRDMLISFTLSLESHVDNSFLDLVNDIELVIFVFNI